MPVFRFLLLLSLVVSGIAGPVMAQSPWAHGPLRVSADGRQFQQADGRPFFWLGDTAWLITQKLGRDEVKTYFENRRAKGFNVVQCCVVQFLNDKSFNGSLAVLNNDISKLNVTPGNNPAVPAQYDYWDHVDYVLDTAAANGIIVAIAPVWSHLVRRTPLTAAQVGPYIEQVAQRFKDRPNVIWLNGGSGRGHENAEVWQVIGETLKRHAPQQLVSYHPFGRTVTTDWFNAAPWLDFNMFTSGHRRYDQDTDGRKYGEDNWRYVLEARAADPKRPVLDAEPAYENTPQGLHNPAEPYWTAADSRRYAYWSVFAGAAGHTFGENSVRQVYIPAETKPASGAKGFIMDRLETDGAKQMQHLKNLILSRPDFGRVNDQSLAAGDGGEKYNRVLVTRGDGFVLAYTYTGRSFTLQLGALGLANLKASWFNPRTGEVTAVGSHPGSGVVTFNPPGDPAPGNDWVLVLDDASRNFGAPGVPIATVSKPAALKWSGELLRRKPEWFASAAGRAAADTVLRYQSPEGAWPKNTDLLASATADELEKLSPEIVAAIEGAVAWFRAVAMSGKRLDRIKRPDGRTERVLVTDPAAPPLWARFYELGKNRPLYMDRRSEPVYDFSQIDYERRSGYNYHTEAPAQLLSRDYPAWCARRSKSS